MEAYSLLVLAVEELFNEWLKLKTCLHREFIQLFSLLCRLKEIITFPMFRKRFRIKKII